MYPFIVGALVVVTIFFGISATSVLRNVVDNRAASSAAVITNDSTSVELDAPGSAGGGGGSGAPPGIFSDEAAGGSVVDEIGGGEGASASGSGSTAPVIQEVTITYASTLPGGSSAGTNTEASASDILSSLVGGQGVSLNASESFGSSGSGTSISGSGGGGDPNLRVRGDEVRKTLRARGIESFSIPGYLASDGSLTGRLYSQEDIALVVAAHTFKDQNLEEVIFSLGTVSIAYRARGRLFAVIPLTYRVRLSLNPATDTPEERVVVRFPWYKFFLQTYVSKPVLQRELDFVVTNIIRESPITADTQARIFSVVSLALSERFDTVEGSIGTGR